ncbi:MAG: T9SS type A sorting domain-containing protein [Bacteroidia bacterium]|nr:T9SS type A sorting domain-containing protein [Bacteroidia bacterium]
MNRLVKPYILVLCLFWFGILLPIPAQAQFCNWLQVQIGQSVTGNTLSVFIKPNLDVTAAPCNIWSLGSQITMRWPAVLGANPVSSITFNGTAMGFAQNTGLGPGGAIGSDGGDGYYYVQFTNSGSGLQALSAAGNQELFNVDFTASSTPAFEFVPTGAGTIFGNTDPALFMGGQNVFDSFIPNGAFPVEWTHFAARGINGREVELNWGTSIEINNDYFQIEKSVDGQAFEKIAQIEGAGNTTEKQEYFYVDKAYVAERVFYRLKQVDKNGLFEYSKVEEVKLENSFLSNLRFEISPNPAVDFVNFKLQDQAKGAYEVLVVDAFGKQILRESFDLEKGVYQMQVGNLSEGMYYASLIGKDGNQHSIGKFLKQ